ncbi:NAD(P)H-quinone oxidoreductase [Brevirhabdus pacifica]|uniref:NAD(P)H-quinone oxidoreductase n=1 Tax=Brevirhabdus pacifica TaxID=1267768 RepID=A0A1U7DK90_9RHOB|nr:NAD(P)H-quinone oxidoreductase [Brevirhabdus pacifica]APX90299.1 NAD(P)H-quinone oxidoreductase [Brevirhabdus pacifica]PJJ80749.1 putative PIG3 family NAD(P)H quinone oxidoreductase [Brevirhabdus pacifica]
MASKTPADLPAKMKVIEAREPGKPEVLQTAERPVPTPAAHEVLIKVTAAGVNGPDMVQRRGHYPPPKGASDLLGLEVSGEVVALGDDVTGWNTGDRVCALTNGGGYAEYVAVDASHCLPIPQGMSEEDAAGLPETFFTVWSNIFHGHDIPKDGNFLVHGGSGGIGSTAVQLGAAMGLNVFTTAGSAEACQFCTDLGATRAINFHDEDFVAILREAGGADIILDIIGGDYVARNIKASRHDARIVSIAFNAGSKIEIDLMPMMLKRLTLTGSTLRSRPDTFKSVVASALRETVWPLFAQGRLRAVTHAKLPLDQAAEAHEMMEAARHHGKILLLP